MAIDRARTARGALAGAVASGAWAAAQPLDKRLFGVDYDDTELLGKLVTKGPAWPAAGLAWHLANGAAFGAVYSALSDRLPLPSWARGPAAAMTEHAATWPFVLAAHRLVPKAQNVPPAGGAALAQATFRHLLFGIVLGELERRLNPPEAEEVPPYEHVASSNGHGDLEKALSGVS